MQRTEINETGLEVMEDIDDSDYIFIVGSDGSLKSMLLPEDFEIQLTPENVDKVLFKDKADNCFLFKEEEVECPTDSSLISNIPIQS